MYHSVHSQRYGRAKGMKVKHLVQLVALTVLFTWFLYQLNSSHKAKVLSLHAEKEDVIDDELLISDDNGEVRHRGSNDDITAQEEFIDKKSVLNSRKMLPDVTDIPELEQKITEVDRFDDVLRAERVEDLGVLNDLGEGDVDDRANLDEGTVRRAAEVAANSKGEKGERAKERVVDGQKKPLAEKRTTEAAEDRGDGEDEVTESTGKEFHGASEGWTATNFTETVEDDTVVYRSEEIKVKGVDVSSVDRTLADPTATVEDQTEVAGSKALKQKFVLKAREGDGTRLTKQEDSATDHPELDDEAKSSVIAARDDFSKLAETDRTSVQSSETIHSSASAENGVRTGSTSDGLALGPNSVGEMNSRSQQGVKEDTTGGDPSSLQDGVDLVKAEQGRDNVVLHADGQENGEGDHPVQEEAIIGAASLVAQQDQAVQQEAIAEVVATERKPEESLK